jgi:hypothetical protein
MPKSSNGTASNRISALALLALALSARILPPFSLVVGYFQ